MMVKGTIYVDPEQVPFKVNFYFRNHIISTDYYYLKKYDVNALKNSKMSLQRFRTGGN